MKVTLKKIIAIFQVLSQIWPMYKALKIELEQDIRKRS